MQARRGDSAGSLARGCSGYFMRAERLVCMGMQPGIFAADGGGRHSTPGDLMGSGGLMGGEM